MNNTVIIQYCEGENTALDSKRTFKAKTPCPEERK